MPEYDGLDYPASSAAPDGPGAFLALAQDVSTRLQTLEHSYVDTVQELPANGNWPGRMIWVGADSGYYVWNGTTWWAPVPPMQTVVAPSSNPIGAGAMSGFTNIPNMDTITIESDARLVCSMELGGWVRSTGSGEIRAGIAASGATVSPPNEPAWGNTIYINQSPSIGTVSVSCRKTITLNPGTTVISAQAYGSATGRDFNYGSLMVTPIRYTD